MAERTGVRTEFNRRQLISGVGGTAVGLGAAALLPGATPALGGPALGAPAAATNLVGDEVNLFGLDFLPTSSAIGYQQVLEQVGPSTSLYGRGPVHAAGTFSAPAHPPTATAVTSVEIRVAPPPDGTPVAVRVIAVNYNTGAVTIAASGQTSGTGSQLLTLAPTNLVADPSTSITVEADLPLGAAVFGAVLKHTPVPVRSFQAITPKRRYDSRSDVSGILRSGQTRTVAYPDRPAGAVAVVFNLTITATTRAGWVSAYPSGTPFPGTSSINWTAAGQTIANGGVVALGVIPSVTLQCSGGDTHVIIDDLGYHYGA